MAKKHPSDILRVLKTVPPEKLHTEGRAAMVRFSEQQFAAENKRIAERRKRLDPIYTELAAAMRKSPELGSLVRAIDARNKERRRPNELAPAKKNPFAPATPVVRLGSIHVVDSLPFYADTWLGQEGSTNYIHGPTADGNSGDMSFTLQPGEHGSGHISCWAALGATVALPLDPQLPFLDPAVITLTANPSVNWEYTEYSQWWREAAGNMWAGLYVGVFDGEGSFLYSAVNMQNSLASFDDKNLSGFGEDNGSNSALPLSATLPLLLGGGTLGWYLQCWCWIGGSCNADGSNDQSGCWIQMNANCSNLTIDMFGFGL